MPTTDLTRNVFSASASDGARDWAQIEGGESTSFRADAELRRGINLDLGLEALAYLDGRFRRYLAGELDAEARGTLRIRGQIQTPMNLFKESGIAVRLQAAAELAAGASLTLGLSVGDFLALVETDPAMQGLPFRLFEIFMEEVTIGAGVYAKASLSAMAHASLAITGALVATPPNKPGFSVVAEAGAGLKAGAGYRVVANMGFDDARRFVGRTIDVLVDETITQIGNGLPPAAGQQRVLLDATRAPAKMALRTAYEIGELVATRNLAANAAGQSVVSQRCVQVILEETQRYLLDRLLSAAIQDLERGLRVLGLSEAEWDALDDVRTRLGARLQAIPSDPFTLTSPVVAWWEGVIDDAVALLDRLGGWAEPWRMSVSVLWAAAELMFAATRRMLDAAAAASAAALAPAAAHAAFTGPVDSTPPAAVREYVNRVLERDPGTTLRREDLVIFLTEDVVFRLVTEIAPDVDRYLQIFESLPGGRRGFMRQALGALGAMSFEDGGQIDPTETLANLATPLKSFLHIVVEQQLAPSIRPHFQGRGDLALYFDEVILPSMAMAVDVAFDQAQQWAAGGVDRDALAEALSSVIMLSLGRNLVVTSDVLVTTARAEMQQLFAGLAARAGEPDGLGDVLAQLAPSVGRDDVVDAVEDVLSIGADAFTPLPPHTRARVRQLLYEVIAAPITGNASGYATSLKDPVLMPHASAMTELAAELGKMGIQTLEEFVRQLLLRVARFVMDEIKEQIEKLQQTVAGWVDDLKQAVAWLRDQVQHLLNDIARLMDELEQRLIAAANEVQRLLGLFSQAAFRSQLRQAIAAELTRTAEAVLFDNDVYRNWVPTEVKAAARQAMRDTIDFAIDGPIATPIWNLLGGLAFEVNQVIADVRGFDPNRGIATQLRDLIVARAEASVRDLFGADPGIDLAFPVAWDFTLFEGTFFEIRSSGRVDIDLGRIDLPIDDLIKVLRAVLEPLAALDTIVQSLSTALAAAFGTEAQLAQATAQEAQRRVEVSTAEALLQDSATVYLDATIIEPAPGALYDTDIPFRVDLAGAPLSFLGRKPEEQQRVLVWINGKLIDLDTMQATITEPTAASPSVQPPVATAAQPGVATIAAPTPAQPSAPTIAAATVRPGTSAISSPVAQPGAPTFAAPVVQPSAPTLRGARIAATTISPATGLTARTGDTAVPREMEPLRAAHDRMNVATTVSRSAAETMTQVQVLARGDLVVSGSDSPQALIMAAGTASVIGRPPTVSELVRLEAIAKPPVQVLRLAGSLPLASLVEGINSIAVAVTDGAGRRVEKAAAFIVSPPLAEPARRNEARLPAIRVDDSLRLTERLDRPRPPEVVQGIVMRPPLVVRAAAATANLESIEQLRVRVDVGR